MLDLAPVLCDIPNAEPAHPGARHKKQIHVVLGSEDGPLDDSVKYLSVRKYLGHTESLIHGKAVELIA